MAGSGFQRGPRLGVGTPRGALGWLVFLCVAAVVFYQTSHAPKNPPTSTEHAAPLPVPQTAGDAPSAVDFEKLARAGKSNVPVESAGIIVKVLPDDTEGDQHQRLLVAVGPDAAKDTRDAPTILIAHNIDVADRVPARAGDRVKFRGIYMANDRGGVVHWTHHDPAGKHADGWIEVAGKRYQ